MGEEEEGEEGQKAHGAGGEGKVRNSKNFCGRIRFFQPLRFWQRYLDRAKLPRTALITFSLGLAEPGILKTCGQELGDLKNVCDPDTTWSIFPRQTHVHLTHIPGSTVCPPGSATKSRVLLPVSSSS